MDLYQIYDETYKELKKIKIPVKKAKLKISKLKKIRGKCLCVNNKYTIQIMEKLVNSNDEASIKRTLAHELLHTVEGSMNHKDKWLANARKAEDIYHYGLFEAYEETNTAEQGPIKQIYYCEYCGLTYNSYTENDKLRCSWCGREMIRK